MKTELKTKLTWEVEKREIECAGNRINDKVALIRSDTNEILGIRSTNYHPFFNRDLQTLVEKVNDYRGFEFEGYQEFGNGRRILAFFRNTRKDLCLCEQPVKDYLIIGNSHDASSKLFVGTSSFMFRCENQFSEKIRSFERKHTSAVSIEEIQIGQIINSYEQGRAALYARMEKLQMIQIDRKTIDSLLHKLLETEIEICDNTSVIRIKNTNRSRKFREAIHDEMHDLGQTLWGLFNGVTRFTSSEINGAFGNTGGTAEKMNREAMKFCLEHLKIYQN